MKISQSYFGIKDESKWLSFRFSTLYSPLNYHQIPQNIWGKMVFLRYELLVLVWLVWIRLHFQFGSSKLMSQNQKRPMWSSQRPLRPVDGPMRPNEWPLRPVEGPMRPIEWPLRPVEGPLRPVEGPMRPNEWPLRPVEGPMRPIEWPLRPIEWPMRPIGPVQRPLGSSEWPLRPVEWALEPDSYSMFPEW